MTSDIAVLLQLFRQPGVVVHGANTHVMTNLEVCISSAERFVSTASTILGTRGAVPEGRRPDLVDLSDQRRNEITSWIPKSPEDVDRLGSDITGGSIITGSTFDRELVNIQTLLKFARLAYSGHNYDEAKVLLQRFIARSEARYGSDFEERNEALGMLATTHCRLKEWGDAEEIVLIDFEGREKALESLVWCYCEHHRWDDAERILCETIEPESAHEMDAEYTLAEVYLSKGDYNNAIKSCDKIIEILGDEHVLFYMSLTLLAQIYEAKGDAIEAKLHRDLLPPGIEGFSVSKIH